MQNEIASSVAFIPQLSILRTTSVGKEATERDLATGQSFRSQLTSLIPHLRAFARGLHPDQILADDLALRAMLAAWQARSSFRLGSNMKIWAFTILHNVYSSEKSVSRRQQSLGPEIFENSHAAADDPASSVDLLALRGGLSLLPDEQREALILFDAAGIAYDSVAEICGCSVGTVKSRVILARSVLETILQEDGKG